MSLMRRSKPVEGARETAWAPGPSGIAKKGEGFLPSPEFPFLFLNGERLIMEYAHARAF